MKKTDEQKQMIRDNHLIPLFWKVVTDKEKHMLIVNTFTGEYLVIEK
jgi:hypothetical protein